MSQTSMSGVEDMAIIDKHLDEVAGSMNGTRWRWDAEARFGDSGPGAYLVDLGNGLRPFYTSRDVLRKRLCRGPVNRAAWHWYPSVLRQVERFGLRWEVVEELWSWDLGTSPGDIAWDGQKLKIERSCPVEWIVHEIAHFIVCERDTPELVDTKNWGFDSWELEGGHFEKVVDTEHRAATLTVAILTRLGLPWHWAAEEMNLTDPNVWLHGRRRVRGSKEWAKVREDAFAGSRVYFEPYF